MESFRRGSVPNPECAGLLPSPRRHAEPLSVEDNDQAYNMKALADTLARLDIDYEENEDYFDGIMFAVHCFGYDVKFDHVCEIFKVEEKS